MPSVTDLFCGMGGLSYGFYKAGFSVLGYDINKHSPDIFKINNFDKTSIYEARIENLANTAIKTRSDVIIGGPPCKPWSTINITKRGQRHQDYRLIENFFYTIYFNRPKAFLMENVQQIKRSEPYVRWLNILEKYYNIGNKIVRYDNYGAATKRRRLITVGFLKHVSEVNAFYDLLKQCEKNPTPIWDVIHQYQDIEKNDYPDHIWPNLKTIEKYKKYYLSGKYGWYHLKQDEPAPSFGNVMKTYTLHPNGKRVVSVREVMSIMGFPSEFKFPNNIGLTRRYQMIADVVSPVFSYVCAKGMKRLLFNNEQ